MKPFYLDKLTRRYAHEGEDHPGAFEELRERYRQLKITSLMDMAAVASTLAIDTIETRELDPLALKAIQDTNPNFDSNTDYSSDEWMGIVNSAKGKYFEYEVVERLNDGDTVGDVSLPNGYTAKVADSMTQPGWDIQILDEHGHVDQYLQLKATDNVDYVRDALERYPDITILTTDEVAEHMPNNSMVLDSGITEDEIRQAVDLQGAARGEGFLDEFWGNFNPLIPLLLIAGTQGYKVAVSKQTVESAAEVAQARAARALTALGVGALFKTFGAGLMSIPAAIFTGWLFDRSQNIDALIKTTHRHNHLLRLRTDHFKALMAKGA